MKDWDRFSKQEDGAEESGRPKNKKREAGWVLLVTQSLAAILILLFGLVFRAIGGGAFDQVRDQFSRLLSDNSVVDSVLSLWLPPEEDAVTEDGPTEAADFVSAALRLPLYGGDGDG